MGQQQAKNRVGGRSPQQQQDGTVRQGHGLLLESLIWTYVVQLSSALRTIHAANLAIRCLDPSKLLLGVPICGVVDGARHVDGNVLEAG
ncbi:PAB-dependent poly(A)-specific ribonuclease subunit 3-like [Tropilaelaps mercedesae]|uniref:PAB-dependent poly(A)-specific ribonuclease subunit 3-like n=1 Tax=Tropilaelaps mercedesae TaxID=418985 RepID=A0A1V9WZV7_9ACAR|nr:PAB-dependent poly(A)-specific ribonuclease subunit 3-like [Tropilaelaps mercedesae]